MSFVARKQELALLNNLDARPGPQFLVLYGRRRVGKTRLVTHWLSQRTEKSLYWVATQTTAANQLRKFSQAIFAYLHPGIHIEPAFSYGTWEAAFAELAQAAQTERLVVVLDEFTYVMQGDPEVPSLIQKIWDHQLAATKLFLILTGSQAGIIQRAVLDYQSPLYGRATARLKLQPLSFGALADMLPRYTPEQRVAVYAISGGIPAYAELFDDDLTLLDNLQERIVTPSNMGELPFLPDRIGSFWSQRAQVDVVALNRRTHHLLMGECKWSPNPVDASVLQGLTAKTGKVLPEQDAAWRLHYVLFARRQFAPAAEEAAKEINAQMVLLSQVEDDFRRWIER